MEGSTHRTSTDDAASQVFDLFPHGLLLLDGEGHVLEVNEAAREMLGTVVPGEELAELVCCELVGCGAPDGPFEHDCLTQLALDAPSPLPEVRIELPEGAEVSSAWATAAVLETDPVRVLVKLREGDSADRRRRDTHVWEPPARLSIFALGRMRVQSPDEELLGGPWLGQRPGQVLKYLISERQRVVSAEEIAEALWPGGEQRGVTNVRYLVYTLRTRLEPERGRREQSRFILAERGGYRLNLEAVEIDADSFERSARSGLDHLSQGRTQEAEELLRNAVTLYAGDFLADEPYAHWAFAERDRLRDLASETLGALVRIYREAGELDAAHILLDRRADMHPFDPEIQRQAIALAIQRGRHTVARRRYAALRHRLLEEYGQEPPFDLADIAASAEKDD
jgi:DNA-binding SARP family transcriptional activator